MTGDTDRERDHPKPGGALEPRAGGTGLPGDELARANADLDRLVAEAEELAADADRREAPDDGSGADLPAVRSGGGRTPEQTKAEMARLRSRVARKQEELAEKRAEVKRLMEERLRRAEAALGPLREMARQIEEGIWTVNLYLGRDEEILTLAGGEPAPADEPIVVRQLVLAMDQECAVASEDGGIDAIDIEEFDGWLLADPAHVKQVIPERKGVVALVPRFGAKDYGDPWKTTAVAEANRQTYFLIRNGERLYRTWTAFNVGSTLVPGRDEFTSFFEETRTEWAEPMGPHRRVKRVKVPLEPGTLAWQRAEERADARRRHYMRAALVLQGLLERTTVFHPLPADELGVGFLDERHYFADRVRIVMDAEPALTEAGHEPFREWQRRLMARLRVGMRIVGNFRGEDWRYANAGDEGPESRRLYPPHAPPPTTGEVYTIGERRRGGALVFRYDREDEIYDRDAWRDNPDRPGWGWRGEWRKAKTRASCTVYPEDRFLIPFDLAEVPEMERFLRSRTERGEYLTMFPVLKAAIAAKRAEAAGEEPFRLMLAGVLARENGVSVDRAAEEVPDLVWWYKLANRHHRPLVGGEAENGAAVRAIAAEHARRVRDREREERRRSQEGPEGEIVSRLLGLHPGALVVARKRDASWVVLTPERDAEAPDPSVFASEYEYGAREASRPKGENPVPRAGFPKRWIIPGSRPARANWRVLHATDRWRDWDLGASISEHLSDPERAALAREIADAVGPERLMYVFYVPEGNLGHDLHRKFGVWTFDAKDARKATADEARPLTGRYLRAPDVGHRTYRWRRGPDRAPYLEAPSREWSRTIRHDGRPPGIVLVEGEAPIAAYGAAEERHKEAEARLRDLSGRAGTAAHAIERAWFARAERAAYRRFMEDYEDPGLWEGHKKTLRISYPHQGSGLRRLVERLVEEGVEFGGLSVAQASALAKERGIGPDFDVPEDLADLRFPAEGEGP